MEYTTFLQKYFKLLYILAVLVVFALCYLLKSLPMAFFCQSVIIIIFSYLGYINCEMSESFSDEKKSRRKEKIKRLIKHQLLALVFVLILQVMISLDMHDLIPFAIAQMILVFLVMNTTLWQIERKSRY